MHFNNIQQLENKRKKLLSQSASAVERLTAIRNKMDNIYINCVGKYSKCGFYKNTTMTFAANFSVVCIKYLRGKNFVGKNFRHLPKISSLFTEENFNLVFYMRTFL